MPNKPPRPCRHKGCVAVTTAKDGYCEQHKGSILPRKRVAPRPLSQERLERKRFYQRNEWRTLRDERLRIEPLCRICRAAGRYTEATVVDHIKEFKHPWDALATNRLNLQSLCVNCHNKKTADNQ